MNGKTWQLVPVSVAVLALVIVGLGGCNMAEAVEEANHMRELEITTPPLRDLSPGTYRGSYEAGLVAAEVEATVSGGTITTLTLLRHDTWRGGDAEVLIERILDEQSLDLDVVTGATISSKTILKATEVALSGNG